MVDGSFRDPMIGPIHTPTIGPTEEGLIQILPIGSHP